MTAYSNVTLTDSETHFNWWTNQPSKIFYTSVAISTYTASLLSWLSSDSANSLSLSCRWQACADFGWVTTTCYTSLMTKPIVHLFWKKSKAVKKYNMIWRTQINTCVVSCYTKILAPDSKMKSTKNYHILSLIILKTSQF